MTETGVKSSFRHDARMRNVDVNRVPGWKLVIMRETKMKTNKIFHSRLREMK